MAIFPFLGSGTLTEAFNIDHALVSRPLLPGETRMRSPFPYPALDVWRRTAFTSTATTPTTGSSDVATRGRTTLLFAHEADLGSIFFALLQTNEALLAGYYVDKLKAQAVDKAFKPVYGQQHLVLAELKTLSVPVQHVELIKSRLEGPSFNHRVAGLCAAVYLTSILLTEEIA